MSSLVDMKVNHKPEPHCTSASRAGRACRFLIAAAAFLPLAAGCAKEKPPAYHPAARPAAHASHMQAAAQMTDKKEPSLPRQVTSHAVKAPFQSLRLEYECAPGDSAPIVVYPVRLSKTLANLARDTRPNGYYAYNYNDCSQSLTVVFTNARLGEYGMKENRLMKYSAELVFQPDNSRISITMEGVPCSGEPSCVSLWEGVWIKTDYNPDPASKRASMYMHKDVTPYLNAIKSEFEGEQSVRTRWILDTVRIYSNRAIGFFAITESPPGEPMGKHKGGYLAVGTAYTMEPSRTTGSYWLLLEPGVPVPKSLGIEGMKLERLD